MEVLPGHAGVPLCLGERASRCAGSTSITSRWTTPSAWCGTFFITDRFGSRIDAEDERAALRTAVSLTKQFTHFLTSAPDPAAAIHAFDQLVDVVVAREKGAARRRS